MDGPALSRRLQNRPRPFECTSEFAAGICVGLRSAQPSGCSRTLTRSRGGCWTRWKRVFWNRNPRAKAIGGNALKRLQIGIEIQTGKWAARGGRADSAAPVVTVGYLLQDRVSPRAAGTQRVCSPLRTHDVSGLRVMPRRCSTSSWLIPAVACWNGSTSYDVTNYYEAVPSNALERVLWLEADRMRALKVDDENLTTSVTL